MRILFFGPVSDLAPAGGIEINGGVGIDDLESLLGHMQRDYPELVAVLRRPETLVAVNAQMLEGGRHCRLAAGDEIAFMSPMSGG